MYVLGDILCEIIRRSAIKPAVEDIAPFGRRIGCRCRAICPYLRRHARIKGDGIYPGRGSVERSSGNHAGIIDSAVEYAVVNGAAGGDLFVKCAAGNCSGVFNGIMICAALDRSKSRV